jgi:hypothetical protein
LAETGLSPDEKMKTLMKIRTQIDIVALSERLNENIQKLWRVKSIKNTKSVNIFETLSKEEYKAWVTLSFEPTILVR